MTKDELMAKKHTDWPDDKRGALELALRDAYAAGCNAARCMSLDVALSYAQRTAPRIAEMLVGGHKEK